MLLSLSLLHKKVSTAHNGFKVSVQHNLRYEVTAPQYSSILLLPLFVAAVYVVSVQQVPFGYKGNYSPHNDGCSCCTEISRNISASKD